MAQATAKKAALNLKCPGYSCSVSIFDEVITGFRLGPGGYTELSGITPDLATFGKVIGGGLPVGAFGGRKDIMAVLSPDGPVYQAGTLSGNPVAMAAGIATLDQLERAGGWDHINDLGAKLVAPLAPVLEAPCARLVRAGSIFWMSLSADTPPRASEGISPESAERYSPIFHALLERGIALAPSAYEVGFLSTAHTTDHIKQFTQAIDEVMALE
mgnify:CR=1 FL=1